MLSEGGAQRIDARMLDALRPTIATLSAAHRHRDSFAVERRLGGDLHDGNRRRPSVGSAHTSR
jgi:hypothetical protein